MRLALAQINSTVGDLDGNVARIVGRLREAAHRRSGPRPLSGARSHRLSARGSPLPARLPAGGASGRRAGGRRGDRDLRPRRRAVARPGSPQRLRDLCRRRDQGRLPEALPAELRRFRRAALLPAGSRVVPAAVGEALIGPTVCEDIWQPGRPATDLALAGAHVIANISASPFHVGKGLEREEMLITPRPGQRLLGRARQRRRRPGRADLRRPQRRDRRGGRGGRPRAVVRRGAAPGRHRRLDGDRATARATPGGGRWPASARSPTRPWSTSASHAAQDGPVKPYVAEPLDELEQMRRALELGLYDYVEKNGFGDVVLGVSGGIDSALTAALAVEALGPERVALRLDAVAVLLGRDPQRRETARRQSRARASSRSRSIRSSTTSPRRSHRSSTVETRTSPRRTSRPGSAGRS